MRKLTFIDGYNEADDCRAWRIEGGVEGIAGDKATKQPIIAGIRCQKSLSMMALTAILKLTILSKGSPSMSM